LLIRLYRLFDLDVWFDEVTILFMLNHSYGEIWDLCKNDNFPPLIPWIYNFWNAHFPGEHSLRFASALMGALTPPAAYFLGREILDKRLGILLGLGTTLSVSLIFHSQMIRMYCIFTFFACISLIFFLRAIKSGSMRHWLIVAAANLLGFYTFLFMIFLIAFEMLWLLWHFRKDIKKFITPLAIHIPVFLLILFWIIPLVQRFSVIEAGFALSPVTFADILKLWVFLGTGSYFKDTYWLAALLNFPLAFGFIIGAIALWKVPPGRMAVALFFLTVISVYLISYFGQSIFLKRYFIFLLPVYLAIAFAGWLIISRPIYRYIGLGITGIVFLISIVNYFSNYYIEHHSYGFCLPYSEQERGDGHAISFISDYIENEIEHDEVIIHFSNPSYRNLSFFPSVYYHNRSLREYLYSKTGVRHWAGVQYLRPGEMLTSLSGLDPFPTGIWLVSLDQTEGFFDERVVYDHSDRYRWIYPDNLPLELIESGYTVYNQTRRGTVSAIHLLRDHDSQK
jgi:hypothetical protein